MTPDERAGLIARLDAYNDQLAEAATQLDYGSLDRAADLAALYEDRAWVEELEPVAAVDARGRTRGRPVDPASRTRFNQWLREKRGWKLVATSSGRLLRVHEWMGNFDARGISNRLTGERAVRPLYRLQRLGLGDRTTEVMARALDLAGPGVVTSEHTRQAVRDFLAEQPKLPKATVRRRKVESECETAFDKVMEDVWAITVHGPEGRPYLERVMAFVNRQLQEIPAEGGNAAVRVKAS
jgi:hypothetical protein